MNGKLETVRTLVELGVDKEAKTDLVRNLMMMMMMFTQCSYNLYIYDMMHEAQNSSSLSIDVIIMTDIIIISIIIIY